MGGFNQSVGFPVQFGDIIGYPFPLPAVPVLVKSRPVPSPGREPAPGAVLFPLNVDRHWGGAMMKLNTFVPWAKKVDALVWRGATTGSGLRRRFVHGLSRLHRRDIDVKFHAYVKGRWSWLCNEGDARSSSPARGRHGRCGHVCCPVYLAPELSRVALLRYRYVLSLEGHDVASNLKWLMGHNSVVVMPPPTMESWLLEGLLRPYVHYVPVMNVSDVPRALAWMRANEEACLRIVSQANAWVESIVRETTSDALEMLRRTAVAPTPLRFSYY